MAGSENVTDCLRNIIASSCAHMRRIERLICKPVYAEINHGRFLTIVICCCSCQLAGIKRHKELSFFLQPKPQGVVSTNSRVPSDSEDSSTQKKVPRSRKVSQLQTSPLSHTSFESSETDHETMEDATFIKRRAWHSGETGRSSPGESSERFRATSCLPVLVVDMSPRTPPRSNVPRIAKRRKGIPQRAPLGA